MKSLICQIMPNNGIFAVLGGHCALDMAQNSITLNIFNSKSEES